MRNLVRRAAATAFVTAGIAAGGAVVPAAATVQYAVDTFYTCLPSNCALRVEGTVTWNNRTATIKGKVTNGIGGSATATFIAYAGTEVDRTTRTASGVSTTPFGPFVIGDTDLVGGINKIRIEIDHYGGLVVPGGSEVELRD